MELKLSNEQIERAAQAVKQCGDHAGITERLRAAAPYLQAPLAEPTPKEADQLACDLSMKVRNGVRFEWISTSQTYELLCEFVTRRNQPPSDPRREAVRKVLSEMPLGTCAGFEKYADKVLAALDALEVQK